MLELVLFVIVGALASLLLVDRAELHVRFAYAILASVSISSLTVFVLTLAGIYSALNLTASLALIILALGTWYAAKREKPTTLLSWRKTILLAGIALLGTGWRWLFRIRANAWGDGLTSHVRPVIEASLERGIVNSVPDLNFYTGLLADYASYPTPSVLDSTIGLSSFVHQSILTWASVFILVALAYACVRAYNPHRGFAWFAAAVMAIGPVEIWQNSFNVIGGDLSYAALMTLVLSMRREDSKHKSMALLIGISMIVTYYTASIVLLIASAGFLATIFLRDLLRSRDLGRSLFSATHDHRALIALAIIVATVCFIAIIAPATSGEHLIGTSSGAYRSYAQSIPGSVTQADLDTDPAISITTPRPTHPYSGGTAFAGYTLIMWQDLLLLLLASTFLLHLFRSKPGEDDIAVLQAIPPMVLIGLAFLIVNMEQRSFSYLAFFAIAAMRANEAWRKRIIVVSLVFLLLTGYIVASERVAFFDNSEGEQAGASWIAANMNGTVLSDARFVSLLAQEGYFDVDGFSDDSRYMTSLFYSDNRSRISRDLCDLGIDYFVSTKRIREAYVLMANFPSEPSNNTNVYEQLYEPIYDNGDVIVFNVSSYGCDYE